MDKNEMYKRWFKKYIRAIHNFDQCQAEAEELESVGSPQAQKAKSVMKVNEMLVRMYEEKVKKYGKKQSSEN